MAIIGSSKALKNLNRELDKIKGKTAKGLNAAAVIVKARSQVKTPVDEGNLRASHYISQGNMINGEVVEIGCTADYAVPVHENLTAHHNVGQAKFLQSAIEESKGDIINAVRKRARIR